MSKISVIGLVGNSAFLAVDEFHKAGETLKAKSIHFEPGGKGFNQAVAAARFGCEVSFL
ncbi:MAG: ribokinase, partial [Clostridia bacterium]|nr:ribokinase [Clostridia bacterium]